jgi:hypothetical protein
MKKHTLCMTVMLVLLLTFGLAGCGEGAGDDITIVAVTGITGVPTAALVGRGLTLSGTVEPAAATNKTIVWSGSGVSNGVLTAASAGSYTVTASIANGVSSSTPYTLSFIITAYDAGTSGTNPFGTDATPFIWVMDDTGGQVYVIIEDDEWEATAEGTLFNSGTYSRIEGTKAGQWTVGGGTYTGNTGLAIIRDDGKMLVANFANQYSDMNGTFTKLETATNLTLEGTWKTDEPFDSQYVKIIGNSGGFTEYISSDGSTWRDMVKGTYPTTGTTNPAICTIDEVNTNEFTGQPGTNWVPWNELSSAVKNNINGGSRLFTVIIYDDRCETYGITLAKQP